MRPMCSQAIEAYMRFWSKEKQGRSLELQGGWGKCTGTQEEQMFGEHMFGKQMFAVLCRDKGGIWSPDSVSSPPAYHTSLMFFVVISADSSLPGPTPLFKFFQAVKKEVKVFLESAGSWLPSAK